MLILRLAHAAADTVAFAIIVDLRQDRLVRVALAVAIVPQQVCVAVAAARARYAVNGMIAAIVPVEK